MSHLRIVRGEPTAEEVAVVTALLAVAGGGEAETPTPQQGRWNDPSHLVRRQLAPGPGAWRSAVR